MPAECLTIERHKIVQIVQICIKLVQISKLGFIFGLWDWASFLSVDWLTACSDSEKTSPASTFTSPSSCKLTTSVCAIRVCRLREW